MVHAISLFSIQQFGKSIGVKTQCYQMASPTVASTVLAWLCGLKPNEMDMGAALFTKNGEGRNFDFDFDVTMAFYARLCMYGPVCMAMYAWPCMHGIYMHGYVRMALYICLCMYGLCMYELTHDIARIWEITKRPLSFTVSVIEDLFSFDSNISRYCEIELSHT